MSYCHLTTFERGKLELLHSQGNSTRSIARKLGRHHSTIARELNGTNRMLYIGLRKRRKIIKSAVNDLSLMGSFL